MSGIDCTLIAYLGPQLSQQSGEKFAQQLMLERNVHNRFFSGNNKKAYWPKHHDWQENARLEYHEAFSDYQKKANQQPMPTDDQGITLQSVAYSVLYEAALSQGGDEALGRARVLMACQDFDLSDDLMQQLCAIPTLDLLLRHLIATAANYRKGDPAQAYLRKYALMQQFSNTQGYLPQQLFLGEEPILSLTLEDKGNGLVQAFQCYGQWEILFSHHPHLLISQQGGMGKSTFLKGLKASFLEKKPKDGAPDQVFYLPLRSISPLQLKGLSQCSEPEHAIWQDHLLWYCICLGQIAQYLAIQETLQKKKRILILLDGYEEISDAPDVKSAIQQSLQKLLMEEGVAVILTSRFPPVWENGSRSFEEATLSGVPAQKIASLVRAHHLPSTPSIQQLCSIPLYYGLLRVHFSHASQPPNPLFLHRYGLLQLAFDGALQRELRQQKEEERPFILYSWLKILPPLALEMAALCPSPSESQLMRIVFQIQQQLQQASFLQEIYQSYFSTETVPYLSAPPSPARIIQILITGGWLVKEKQQYRFARHQDFRDHLAARLLNAKIQTLLNNYPDDELAHQLTVSLNLPRHITSLLREALFQISPWDEQHLPLEKRQNLLQQGLEKLFGHLPEIASHQELGDGVIACGRLLRDLSEYLSLHTKDYGVQFLPFLEKITRCLLSPGAPALGQKSWDMLEAPLQKTAEIYRRMGRYEDGIALLAKCPQDRPALQHQRAKLLMENALKHQEPLSRMDEGLKLLKSCAEKQYYLSCSLYGMLLSAPHPLLLKQGLMKADAVQAAQIYLAGCLEGHHSGTDIVYLVRNLLMLLYRGAVTTDALQPAPDALASFSAGNGRFPQSNPPLAKALLKAVLPYHGTRCCLPLGCYHLLEGNPEKAAQALKQDGSLLARLIAQAYLPKLLPASREELQFLLNKELEAAENTALSIESYHPLYRYLDSQEMALSLAIMTEKDILALEDSASPALKALLTLARCQRNAPLK